MTWLIYGTITCSSLEGSFIRALNDRGISTVSINAKLPQDSLSRKIAFRLRRMLGAHYYVNKNKNKVLKQLSKYEVSAILVFGKSDISRSLLMHLNAQNITTILYWPDPIINVTDSVLNSLFLYDYIFCHCKSFADVFRALNKNSFHLGLAGDKALHYREGEPDEFKYDIGFIGGWRPSRELLLSRLINRFPSLKIAIYGYGWSKFCEDKLVLKRCKNQVLLGEEYADFINNCMINLNPIDEYGYPGSNMRFYEIPMAYGLQLTSHVPEECQYWRDGENIIYYNSVTECLQKVEWILANPREASCIRRSASEFCLEKHTYSDRINEMMKSVMC